LSRQEIAEIADKEIAEAFDSLQIPKPCFVMPAGVPSEFSGQNHVVVKPLKFVFRARLEGGGQASGGGTTHTDGTNVACERRVEQ
jgi:hypothetical protein